MKKSILILGLLALILITQIAIAEQSYEIDSDELKATSTNTLLATAGERISMLIPALFIIISVIAFMIDFGTIGVVLGSMVGLGLCVMIGIVLLNAIVLVAFIVMGIILVFKLGA